MLILNWNVLNHATYKIASKEFHSIPLPPPPMRAGIWQIVALAELGRCVEGYKAGRKSHALSLLIGRGLGKGLHGLVEGLGLTGWACYLPTVPLDRKGRDTHFPLTGVTCIICKQTISEYQGPDVVDGTPNQSVSFPSEETGCWVEKH